TELDSTVEQAIIIFCRTSGLTFFLLNVSLCLVIIFDSDVRGRGYRKYLIVLQTSSMTFDLFSNLYVPIIQVNCRILYSSSFLADYLDIVYFATIEVFLFGQVLCAYFACVYYRRNMILPRGRRFCFVGWRRVVVFLSLQIVAWSVCVAMYTFLRDWKEEA
ncbi:hypothetical protein PFISCL1PPCAC_13456, partial [Pristionchus fissidentatus]